MKYKVLKRFKCREQKMKLFSAGDGYTTADESRAENLIKLRFIEKVEVPEKPKKVPEKQEVEKVEKKKDDAK
ncbi:hypothetical protein [Sporosarcina sp. FSL K6-3457]|uniref:hypothetical protein n=1 Tax=Sporosarcina sp. FSL K6-3457 TaxID=2978204 RepID=UPI0030FA8B5F